jgi:hypothetical protein
MRAGRQPCCVDDDSKPCHVKTMSESCVSLFRPPSAVLEWVERQQAPKQAKTGSLTLLQQLGAAVESLELLQSQVF